MDTARSLWVIYRQIPAAVRDEFRKLLEHEEEDTTGWVQPTEVNPQDDQETPEVAASNPV